jgi:23S rRNA (cytidine1920-2'-O)/16S rRNA (cytidine1409-2'-O)-methyltransferase
MVAAQDPRVRVHDRTNIRDVTPELVGGPVDLVVGDLSFISSSWCSTPCSA